MGTGAFWVGAEPVASEHGAVPRGPMYVQWESPAEPIRALPIVFVHGGGGQGTDYLSTPDGRPGWAPLLVEQGWTVYVVDRPGHGRSPHHPDVLGAMTPPPTVELVRALFLGQDPEPHEQWPGSGDADDAVLEQLVAAAGPMQADWRAMHALEQRRMAELLDRIGPAILVVHSAGAPAGFLAADARPQLVRALVALEAIGPPFLEIPALGVSLEWGVSAAPLTLERLAQVPIAAVSAEASGRLENDRRLVAFLQEAGCRVDLVRLADHGVHGNGHGMMFEKNHADVLAVLTTWIDGACQP